MNCNTLTNDERDTACPRSRVHFYIVLYNHKKDRQDKDTSRNKDRLIQRQTAKESKKEWHTDRYKDK